MRTKLLTLPPNLRSLRGGRSRPRHSGAWVGARVALLRSPTLRSSAPIIRIWPTAILAQRR